MEYGALDEDTRLESRPPESGDVEPALFVEPPKLDTFLNAFADDGTELDLVTKASTTTTTTRTPTTENDSSDGGEVEKVESLKADLRWWIPSTSGQWLASIASSRALTPRDRVMVNGRPTQNPARIRAWTLDSLREARPTFSNGRKHAARFTARIMEAATKYDGFPSPASNPAPFVVTTEAFLGLTSQVQALADEVQKEVLKSRGEIGESSKGGSPFTPEIQGKPLSTTFRLPTLEPYDGSDDPTEHIAAFRAQMALYDTSDALMCRAFLTNLRRPARTWYSRLRPEMLQQAHQYMAAETLVAGKRDKSKHPLVGINGRPELKPFPRPEL
ncbi:hypothetical protein B296_00005191 [Ensete ventricosum]|uniref:Retrotransposon gag domain-containing protein n=1 Tax=Ensete ventricosum TaxID=4639 RepID=A0A427ASM8_ENSVE|nr:hypothetical protein B296_00005191 [Ensete ventricosum]